jgi:cytochrome c oxidase subunit 5b
MVRSAGEEQYAGCTGFPADSHNVIWLTVSAQSLLTEPTKRPKEGG